MLSVGVWIDLRLRPEAGGHVKIWQRLAEAAIGLEDELDLTVHFLGDQEQEISLGVNVRYVQHKPRFGTDRLPLLKNVADQTDLAPSNPKLFPYLTQHDVLHTTHQLFTFGQTALQFAQRYHKPLVGSIHTDVPIYAEIYATEILQQLFGNGFFGRRFVDPLQLPQKNRRKMERQLQDYWPHCKHILVSQQLDYEQVTQVMPPACVSYLRRGINKDLFHPRQRDRQKLQHLYGIDPEIPLLLFVGRIDPGKSVMTFAQAVRRLLDRGYPVHAFLAGPGSSALEIQQLLGSSATLPGVLPPATLAWIYASADLFVFPSETETYGNVVIEAKASGLPVVISSQGGVTQLFQGNGIDGYQISSNDPVEWSEVLAQLLAHPEKLKDMGALARRHLENHYPSWREVLTEDLLPVWQRVA
jgi:glycosyltransferase involved in cell wall biosynthesis